MLSINYIYSRVLKKLRGAAIASSDIHSSSKVESGSTVVKSKMDRHTYCGYDCTIINSQIGAFTSIANDVNIGGSMHPMEYVSMSPVFLSHKDSVKKKYAKHQFENIPTTNVGSDVWIGAGVFVKSGVKIGNGAVVGMGSVVTKDIAPYSVYAGNPAKFIRKRFDDDTILNLIDIAWWDFSDELLEHVGQYIIDPLKFVEECKKLLKDKD